MGEPPNGVSVSGSSQTCPCLRPASAGEGHRNMHILKSWPFEIFKI